MCVLTFYAAWAVEDAMRVQRKQERQPVPNQICPHCGKAIFKDRC